MHRRSVICRGALALLTLIGCGEPTAPGALPPRPTPAPRLATPAMTPGPIVVTLGDVDATISIRVGERFLLNLGLGGELEPYDWTAVSADPSIVSRVPNVLTVLGSQGLYEGHRPGQTELTAHGEATCRRTEPPCAVPSRSFGVTVVVEP